MQIYVPWYIEIEENEMTIIINQSLCKVFKYLCNPILRMKTLFVVLAVTLALAVARPQEEASTQGSGQEGGQGGGSEGGGHHRGPHPDCPDLKALISGKCPDRSNRECFKCVFEGCHPKDEEAAPPTCEATTACVTANIEKC
jgi:hypothetical protein